MLGFLIATIPMPACGAAHEESMIEEWRETTAVLTPYALTMLYGHPANDATYVRLCKAIQAAIPRNRLHEMVQADFIQEIDDEMATMCHAAESDSIGMENCAMWCRSSWISLRLSVDVEAKRIRQHYLPSLVLEY